MIKLVDDDFIAKREENEKAKADLQRAIKNAEANVKFVLEQVTPEQEVEALKQMAREWDLSAQLAKNLIKMDADAAKETKH